MVDPTWFKTRTTIPRQPKALQPVPHGGLKSLYAESFQQPSDVKAKENYYCAVDTPFVLPSKFLDNYTFHVCVSGIISQIFTCNNMHTCFKVVDKKLVDSYCSDSFLLAYN